MYLLFLAVWPDVPRRSRYALIAEFFGVSHISFRPLVLALSVLSLSLLLLLSLLLPYPFSQTHTRTRRKGGSGSRIKETGGPDVFMLPRHGHAHAHAHILRVRRTRVAREPAREFALVARKQTRFSTV